MGVQAAAARWSRRFVATARASAAAASSTVGRVRLSDLPSAAEGHELFLLGVGVGYGDAAAQEKEATDAEGR